MDFANIQAQLANLTSQLSQIAERTTTQSVPTFGVPYGQGYQLHQRPQIPANVDAWGYQGYDQPSNNMFPNTYNSDWRDYSDYMWGEPQQFQQSGYWQPYEEFYSRHAQPPQPHIQYAQPNSGSLIDYNQKLADLLSLVQGSQNQTKEAPQGGYWQQEEYSQPSEEFYQWPYAPSQPPPQSAQFNSGTSMDNDTFNKLLTSLNQEVETRNKEMQIQTKKTGELEKHIGQIMEFMAQIQEQSEVSNSTIENSKEDFEIHDAITLGSAMEVGADLKTSQHCLEVDEELLIEEEEEDIHTAREEPPLPQPPKPSKLPTTGKDVPNSFHSNVIPPNAPFPCRFLIPKEEESEKDIVEVLPKVQVAGEHVECIKEDVVEMTNAKEVEFVDTGQVTTIVVNLAKCKVPETFQDVVFVIEFVTKQASKPSSPTSILFSTNLLILMIQAPTLEFRPLLDHFKYHRPFNDKPMHSTKEDLGITPIPDLRS